ncbi:hypothetical protein ROTAS13_03152 [Roseomonas sp. TAS13]|nr:hypothetical protein ROTAS13_03152 [Roseomonas sp. TAS13]
MARSASVRGSPSEAGVTQRATSVSTSGSMPSARTVAARSIQPWAGGMASAVSTSVRLRTRPGAWAASDWAIIPPMEMPATCALSTPIRSSRPSMSRAMPSML